MEVAVVLRRVDVTPKLDFVAVIPDVPLATERARAALPAQYSRADVVANLQRTALLTACFFSGRRLSPELFRDRLHQPYRSPLVPGIAACLDFRHRGLAGIFLSGAGSAVMAIAEHSAARIGEALIAEFRRKGTAAKALLLKADNQGTQVTGSGRDAHSRPCCGHTYAARLAWFAVRNSEKSAHLSAKRNNSSSCVRNSVFAVAIFHDHRRIERDSPFLSWSTRNWTRPCHHNGLFRNDQRLISVAE